MYRIIVKVGKDKFVKYRSENLLSFTRFIDRDYPDWKWFNVYCKKSGDQLASFTYKHKPDSKRLQH